MEQGSEEWHLARLGKPTGSNFAKVMGSKTVREGYLEDLICQQLTGKPPEEIRSYAITWGKENESLARNLYSATQLCEVREEGFILHPHLNAGCSVDGIVDPNGINEIKCPYNSRNHLKTIESRQVPPQYVAQVQGNMLITGCDWCDFVSFDPRFPDEFQLCIVRVEADDRFQKNLYDALAEFCGDLSARVESVKHHQLLLSVNNAFSNTPSLEKPEVTE